MIIKLQTYSNSQPQGHHSAKTWTSIFIFIIFNIIGFNIKNKSSKLKAINFTSFVFLIFFFFTYNNKLLA